MGERREITAVDPVRPTVSLRKHIYHCNDWNQDPKVPRAARCLGGTKNWSQFSFHEQLGKPLAQSWASYLQSRAFVRGPLAGSFPFETQLNEKLQQVDEQLVHHLLGLEVGGDIAQSIDHSQGAVPVTQKQGRLKGFRTHFYTL